VEREYDSGRAEGPLTAEPAMGAEAPLTSEPPLSTAPPLTSEPPTIAGAAEI
jgi:hypothetical protein